jgi:hypothetical protein
MSLAIKQLALATIFSLTVGLTSTFAATKINDNGTDAVTVSFHKDFKKAELISTEVKKDYTKLTFKMNGMVMFAFYSESGDLLAVTRNIQSSQLPIQLLINVKKDYADYWISDLFEYTGDGVTSYYITLENADTRITLRSNGSDWDTYNKTEKH